MHLTQKQIRFVQEYLLDFNATQAAIRAGYSPQTARVQASQNLAKLNIRSKIEAEFELRRQSIDYDVQWVIEGLKEIHNLAMLKEDYSAAVKALYLLGKHRGMFGRNYLAEDTDTASLAGVVINITQEASLA